MIVDASVVVCWFVPQQQSKSAREFMTTTVGLTAPALLSLEVANALLRCARQGTDGARDYRSVLDFMLPKIVYFVDDFRSLVPDAVEIAEREGRSPYDACYTALARRLAMPLATADQQQATIARKMGIEVKFIV